MSIQDTIRTTLMSELVEDWIEVNDECDLRDFLGSIIDMVMRDTLGNLCKVTKCLLEEDGGWFLFTKWGETSKIPINIVSSRNYQIKICLR